jgi:hypothetical protein
MLPWEVQNCIISLLASQVGADREPGNGRGRTSGMAVVARTLRPRQLVESGTAAAGEALAGGSA